MCKNICLICFLRLVFIDLSTANDFGHCTSSTTAEKTETDPISVIGFITFPTLTMSEKTCLSAVRL